MSIFEQDNQQPYFTAWPDLSGFLIQSSTTVFYIMQMKPLFLFLLLPIQLLAQFTHEELARYEKEASRVSIIRDNWGIPHIYGKKDADAVFGLLYAQCEDDFNRVEMNYIEKCGRLSEVNGEKMLYSDLLIRMIIDTADAKHDYQQAPEWLRKLCDAFADGVNYYLSKHPQTKPILLHHFEPWYPLLWTDGSIGAISTAGFTENDLRKLYGNEWIQDQHVYFKDNATAATALNPVDKEALEELFTGSNGFAFAPSITEDGHAILYINPHVTFYFRPEVQMVSEEGLNVYGAVTWGQFFVYQGFNEHCGWMHTSSRVDVSDAYIEKISQKDNLWTYTYEQEKKPVTLKKISLQFKRNDSIIRKDFTVLYTHHGPVMARQNGQFISVQSFNRSVISLEQSWLRTKATSFKAFKQILDMRANTSNNTVYADAEGNIGYWHGNYVPIRDTNYQWNKPVDGTIKATEWKGLHTVDEIVQVINPVNGWLQNCNSTPFSVAGAYSPLKKNYPPYMAPDEENFRGINAVRVLDREKKYTIDKVIAAGYDTYLAFFEQLVPALVNAYQQLSPADSLKKNLLEPIAVMKDWDLHAGSHSVATTLAVTWGPLVLNALRASHTNEGDQLVVRINKFAADAANGAVLLSQFSAAVKMVQETYGSWKTEWGTINRFQRLDDAIDAGYDDKLPSIPVGFTSSQWGQIPSFSSKRFPNTKNFYGTYGNSFICAVEFGKKIKARSLLAGGESGNPASPHFTDQAQLYSVGQFKEVLFYKEDVIKHKERTYHPGE